MSKETRRFLGYALILMVVVSALILLIVPRVDELLSKTTAEDERIGLAKNMYQAEVLEIIEEGTVTLGEHTQTYQLLRIEILEGPYKGWIEQVEYGRRQVRPQGLNIRMGDKLLIEMDQMPDGSISTYFVDYVRTRSLLWLLIAFVVFSIIVGGAQGGRGLLGLLLSLGVIMGFIIPSILHGNDPILVSVLGGFLLLSVTLYLIYGWSLKTHAAVLGLLCTLALTGLMVGFFVNLTRLTGYGSEEALFILQQSDITINLRGLVLAGMMIGALGVLDDLLITQASVVFELNDTDPQLDLRQLYQRAIRVGQDHVTAVINTLFMAYAGAALPTLVLFTLSGQEFTHLINLEFIAEEVVRVLAGSLGLILAAPISTAIASLLAVRRSRGADNILERS